VTGGDEPRRGPKRLAAAAIAAFLGQERTGSLCLEDDSGRLRACPVRIVPVGQSGLHVVPADPWVNEAAVGRRPPACLVADEFESYEAIQGVIVQGHLRQDVTSRSDPPSVVIEVTRTVGFTFAGTLPAHLADS
jgi:hypothetical protein